MPQTSWCSSFDSTGCRRYLFAHLAEKDGCHAGVCLGTPHHTKTPLQRMPERGLRVLGWGFWVSDHFFKSKRSKFMTLVQAPTKSVTNFVWLSALA